MFVPGKVSGASASTELPKSYPEWAAALAEAAAAAVAAAPPKAPAAQTAPTATVPVENDIKEKQAANVEAARAWWMGEGQGAAAPSFGEARAVWQQYVEAAGAHTSTNRH